MKESDSKQKIKPIVTNRLPQAFTNALGPRKPVQQKKVSLQGEGYKNNHKKVESAIKKIKKMPLVYTPPPLTLHLQDMITLSVQSSSSKRCTIRKVLHAPSFQIFTVKQIPISTTQERTKLLTWIEAWRRGQESIPGLIKIYNVVFNNPEGFISVIMEYSPYKSLQDLYELIGVVPERILSSILKQVINILLQVNQKLGPHAGITASQILFTRNFEVKLGPGLNSRIQSTSLDSAHDIYDLGFTTLIAAIGGLGVLENTSSVKDSCCMFHSIFQTELPFFRRLTPDFCNLMCCTLQFQIENRWKLDEVYQHHWLNKTNFSQPLVYLPEVLVISHQQFSLSERYRQPGEVQLERIVDSLKLVLADKKINVPRDEEIEGLALELEMSVNVVILKIEELFRS